VILFACNTTANFFAFIERKVYSYGFFLSLHRALWNLYIVHSPTNAHFIKLGKV